VFSKWMSFIFKGDFTLDKNVRHNGAFVNMAFSAFVLRGVEVP